MSEKNGTFVVICGIDGSGKTTVISELKRICKADERDMEKIKFTREPGSYLENNELPEHIRSTIMDFNMDPMTEAYLFAASRSAHSEEIKKELNKDNIVISDRYVYSSIYYQGVVRGLGADVVKNINAPILKNLQPDKIIYLEVSEEERQKRISKRGIENRLDSLNINVDEANDEYMRYIIRSSPRSEIYRVETNFRTPLDIADEISKYIFGQNKHNSK